MKVTKNSRACRTIKEVAKEILALGMENKELKKRTEELENRLKQVCSLCLDKTDLALVAGDETIMVNSALAQSSSIYFATALESGFAETGECPKALFCVCPKLPQLSDPRSAA